MKQEKVNTCIQQYVKIYQSLKERKRQNTQKMQKELLKKEKK